MRTLIVEDDFTSRLLLQEFLASYGSVHIAVNGKEALDAVRSALQAKKPYDLILMDIMMPEMDGHEALTQIRKIEAHYSLVDADQVKVIMVTALGDVDNVIFARQNKVQGYILKPYDLNKLLEELRKLGLIT